MKDLIIIKSYCPDVKRQKLLSNLVESISKKDFDILIISHTTIPQSIQNKVNYVFYDEKNPLYHDMESAPFYWDKLRNKSGYIYHTKLDNPLHILAILRLERFGYQVAKMLGYKKAHTMEYDSIILDNTIFKKNSNLLNNYDAVTYENSQFIKNSIHGGLRSVKLNSLPKEITVYNENLIKKHFKTTKTHLLPEQYHWLLFSKLNTKLLPLSHLTDSIQIALHSHNPQPFRIIPYVKDKILTLYYFNDSRNKSINFTLQLNNQTQHITINPLVWTILPLGLYKDFSYIKITTQDKVYLELDLDIDNNREIFLKRHYHTTHV